MQPTDPRMARLLPRLLVQLVPAALVAGLGIALLGHQTEAPGRQAAPAPVEAAIRAEAVFTAAAREPAEPEASEQAAPTIEAPPVRTAAKPKAPVARRVSAPNDPPAPSEVASVTAPLPILPPDALQTAQPAPPAGENAVVRSLRATADTVRHIPAWAAQTLSGWFPEEEPPRPPMAVPQQFQASM